MLSDDFKELIYIFSKDSLPNEVDLPMQKRSTDLNSQIFRLQNKWKSLIPNIIFLDKHTTNGPSVMVNHI